MCLKLDGAFKPTQQAQVFCYTKELFERLVRLACKLA